MTVEPKAVEPKNEVEPQSRETAPPVPPAPPVTVSPVPTTEDSEDSEYRINSIQETQQEIDNLLLDMQRNQSSSRSSLHNRVVTTLHLLRKITELL